MMRSIISAAACWRVALLAFMVLGGCTGDGNDVADIPVGPADVPDATSDIALPDAVVFPDFASGDTPNDFTSNDTAPIEPGAFLAPCQGNTDCLSGYCVEGENGYFCTQVCTLNCPGGFDCRSVVIGSGDPVFMCLPRIKRTCTPCQADYQCPGGACLDLDDGRRCAPECADADDCGNGYACAADPSGVRSGTFCQPKSGACDCTPDAVGMMRTCLITNDSGTCPGVESCDPDVGWVGCNARTPEEEICDGFDNNCNAFIDEGFEVPQPCENTVEGVGSCAGLRICAGPQGLVCNARQPSAETCDFIDNDCDQAIDEDFKAADGAFTLGEHCGTCNNDCSSRIPNGTGTCSAEGGGQPVCVVAECDPDYIPIGRFQCGLPPDVSCQPCVDDGECFGGTCADVDGQRVCLSPCGGAAESCQAGYACGAVGDTRRCLPVTGSCVCNARTDGQRRTCNVNNDFGVCFGQEVCDGTTGWSGCTARTPAVETCNGIDDDCNGRADDGVTPPPSACESTVAGVGTCVGTWFCNDFDNSGTTWQCNAPTPSTEVCDFLDNNCDGRTDELFRNAAGLYVADDHCGSCGISCDGAIPNATARCGVADGRARCEVAACAPGFYQAGPMTCLPVGENLCAPCVTDANCQTPGDRCLASPDGNYCGRDCGPGNLHGFPVGTCPDGFGCDDVGGALQCRPTSGSCSCLSDDAGRSRTCLNSNDVGTCFGQQLCVADSGWSTCSARTPAGETCNGLDDDCNGVADDVPGRGAACQISNNFGTCAGVLDCGAGDDLNCIGQVPATEACNYADDDCDGGVDEGFAGLFGSCSTGVGACLRFGFRECMADGSGTRCNAVAGDTTAEICDGIDNDCDGTADETPDGRWDARGQPCFDGQGVCRVAGVNVCTADGSALRCSVTAAPPNLAELCNNVDDDCDGLTDEAFPTKGAVCSAGLGVCMRFGTNVCAANGSGVACSAVEGERLTEICDLIDNDCDGNTDEDFKSNGIYATDQTCGNCFTNCRTIFAGAANGYGTCALSGQTAGCQLKCCKPGDALCGGGSGDFYNLNGVPDDGCEFELDAGAIYVSESDGTDNATCGLGPIATAGGRYPCKTLIFGQTRAVALGRGRVLVAGGAYYGNIAMAEGVSLLGGFNPLNWQRAPSSNLTAIFGTQTSGERITVAANNIRTTPTELSGFVIYGEVASGVAENSYAVFVSNSNDRLTLRDNVIWPGRGGPGAAGARGSDGTSGGKGANGVAAFEIENIACAAGCANQSNAGGAAGVNASCATANGGAGGKSDCPDFNENSNLCDTRSLTAAQTNTNNGLAGGGPLAGTGGSGGCDSLISSPVPNAGTDCNCAFANQAACPTGTFSAAGRNGGSGAAGQAGVRATDAAGVVVDGHWRGSSGGNGTVGGNGSGGGGGGGGGGVESWYGSGNNNRCASSLFSDYGGSGGGGGAGGCGSPGGTGGGAGGGAFGIFVNVSGQTSAPVLSGNTLNQGTGGVGGRGGDGGVPGLGGNGGDGGPGGDSGSTVWCAKPGSKGGEGGSGGPGGGGAGGSGGAAYNVYVVGQGALNLGAWTTANTWNSNGVGGAGGAGGGAAPGGTSGDVGRAGPVGLRNY